MWTHSVYDLNMSDVKTSKSLPDNYRQVLGTGRPVTITCSMPTCLWTDVFWLTLRASLLDHGAHLWDTEYCNTSTFSDLGLVVVSGWFLAIPMLLGLLSRYYACLTRAVPLLWILLAGIIWLPFAAKRRTNHAANSKQPYGPSAAINSFPGLPRL